MDRLDELKKDAVDNPSKKKKGCGTCKKKNREINEPLPLPIEMEYIPTAEDIKLAYAHLSRMGGPLDEHKELIDNVFIFLFGSRFDYGCRNCGNKQFTLFTNYIKSMK